MTTVRNLKKKLTLLSGIKPGMLGESDIRYLWWPSFFQSHHIQSYYTRFFLPILPALPPKITIRSFWPACDQMVPLTGVWPKPIFGPFKVRPGHIVKMLTRRDFEDLYANGVKSFPTEFFIHFGRPTAENYNSVILSGVRPNGDFDRRATRIYIWSFRGAARVESSKCWPGETSNLYTNSAEGFPPGLFTHFDRSTGENYDSVFLTSVRQNGVFDQRVTEWCFWPACDQNLGSVLLNIVRLFFYRGTFDQWCD